MKKNVLILPGDGVGPEVVQQAENILARVAGDEINISHAAIGGIAIDNGDKPLPVQTLQAALECDAVLLGAVGSPQYDSLPAPQKPEKGLLNLRKGMGVFANLRPAVCHHELAAASSLKRELVEGLDILIVRELTGGVYFGEPRGIDGTPGQRTGFNTMRYDEDEIARVAKVAFEAAKKRGGWLCSVDKANVLEVSMLWREVVEKTARQYPDVKLSHMYVDNAAMQLVRSPKNFDVILTGNLFGDILSDVAAMLTGSIGMLPSASLNAEGRGLYEPVHGSAPDIAGMDKANPLAAILSAAMLLRYSLNNAAAANRIETAVQKTLAAGYRTADIADDDSFVGCAAMGRAVMENL